MTNLRVAIACSISTSDAVAQAVEWSELGQQALTTERLDGGVAMTFNADIAHSVMDLAAREAECCGFLSITTNLTGQTVRLEITSGNPDHRPMIEALVGMEGGQ